MAVLIIDTEVAGLEDVEVIEMAYIKYDTPQKMRDKEESARNNTRFKPERPITTGAMAVHHIMDEDLVDCPPSSDCRLPEGTVCIVGHNVDFDWKALGSPEVKRICTLALSRWLWPESTSHTLGAMTYQLNRETARDLLRGAHAAMDDVVLCRELFIKIIDEMHKTGLIDKNTTDFLTLWKFSEAARIPKTMPFGKHKGMAIADLPADYVRWMLKQTDIDPYLLMALNGGNNA